MLRLTAALFTLLALGACETQSVKILAINDVYRIEGVDAGSNGGLARVRTVRRQLSQNNPSLIVTLAGDFLYPSLLSRRYNGQQMIDVLNLLDGKDGFDPTFIVTFGNHEFDKSRMKDAWKLSDRMKESEFTWLGSNIEFVPAIEGRAFPDRDHLKTSTILVADGLKIGFFSITTRNKHPDYVEAFLDYEDTARIYSKKLRDAGANIVIGLTHLSEAEDVSILNTLGADGPDLIIGGHEHNRLSHWSTDRKRVVIKADAEARTATLISVSLTAFKRIKTSFEYITLDSSVREDDLVRQRTEAWIKKHETDFCASVNNLDKCLSSPLVKTDVELVGEELEIRRFETNLGNWILDAAKEVYKEEGAQVALMNSGGLRLNQNILAGQSVTRRHIEELIAYPSTLHLIEVDGSVLKAMLNHAVEDWTGNGWFLQVSGIRFNHDSDNQHVSGVTLTDGTIIEDSMRMKIVVNDFLINTRFGQDGYTMIGPDNLISDRKVDLRTLILDQFKRQDSISPATDGRICNVSERADRC